MTSLFLDDERNVSDVTWLSLPETDWYVARTFLWFKLHIQGGMPEYISFDHDLQDFDMDTDEERTGMTCLKWLIEYCMDRDMMIPVCFFHTQNPVGKKNMEEYYKNAVKHWNNA